MTALQEDFSTFYEHSLKPFRDLFIQIKKSARKNAGIAALCLFFLSVSGGCFWYYHDRDVSPVFLGFVVAVLSLLAWLCTYFSLLQKRNRIFNTQILPEILSFADPGLSYHAGRYVSMEHYYDSMLFASHHPDRVSGGQFISGRCRCGVDIGFSYLHTEYKVTRRVNKQTVTEWHDIFNGVFFYADFNKHFHGATMIVPDHETGFLGQGVGQFLQKISWSGPGTLAVMENVEFEKLFAVHTTDQVEARYILTPKMMENLVALAHRNKTGTISVGFNNSKMYLAFPGAQNFFAYRGEEITPEFASRIVDGIRFFTEMASDLNLDVRIWTKE